MQKTAEQQARDLLQRLGVKNAQSYTSGDLVELANMIADANRASSIYPCGCKRLYCLTHGPVTVINDR